jgi:hypothetical protein
MSELAFCSLGVSHDSETGYICPSVFRIHPIAPLDENWNSSNPSVP